MDVRSGQNEDAVFKTIDAGVDIALSPFGLVGGAFGLLYNGAGGSKAVAAGQAQVAQSANLLALAQACAALGE